VHRVIAPQVPGLPCSHLTAEGSSLTIPIMAHTAPRAMSICAHFYVTNYYDLFANDSRLQIGRNTQVHMYYPFSTGFSTGSTGVLLLRNVKE